MAALNIPIQLISACNTVGEFSPLWFRYENEEHKIQTIKIEKVLSHKEEKYCGMNYISYICTAAVGEVYHMIELRYSISSHRWQLFQMLS